MAVSRAPKRNGPGARTTDADDWLPDPSRYDVVLVALPTLLILALAAHVVAGLPLVATLVPASVVGLALVADVVYLHPPTRPPAGRR